MTQTMNLADVHHWAIATSESRDAIRALEKVPARLGLIDTDLGSVPADLVTYDRDIAGRGYGLVGNPKDVEGHGRRMDSRVRTLLKRYWTATNGYQATNGAVRVRWNGLIDVIAANEGVRGSGKQWNIGRHRTLFGLRARSTQAPEDLVQDEIDRIGLEMPATKRDGLRKAVGLMNSLPLLVDEIPELREFLPERRLIPPAGSGRARNVEWWALPEAFRQSFETAAAECVIQGDDLAERLLARIEAGEDPEDIMVEADELASSENDGVDKPEGAVKGYRQGVTWLVRSWEDAGGDVSCLTDVRELFNRQTIEVAILDQIARSQAAPDLKDPYVSTTLKARLTALTTLARRGLKDAQAVVTIRLLRIKHYDAPRKKIVKTENGEGILMDVDRIAAKLRQKPALSSTYTNAPRRIADAARREIENARRLGSVSRELTALRVFAGAVVYVLQFSRPMRTSCPRHARIASDGEAHANLIRTSPDENIFTFKFAPWEIKNKRWVTVDVVGEDAAIVREWLEVWRPRLIELKNLSPRNVFLFPGEAMPVQDRNDPVTLPRGCYSPSAFLDVWRDASAVVGVEETPHRMRHVVGLLILALRPGDYAFVSVILGIKQTTAEKHYGRDEGQAAAREARAAMLAAHPEMFTKLRTRFTHE